jgi:signal recognition particle receptor subunit beta
MSDVTEVKIIFTGTMGAGKTTAINAISEIKTISTEAVATDETAQRKATTTVGMDYGEVTVDEGLVLRLYGTPGQRRFRHMWEILAKGALGFVILVDNARPSPLEDLSIYLDNFKHYIAASAAVIGVTRTDVSTQPDIDAYYRYLAEREEMHPVMTVDVRRKEDVLMLLDTLLLSREFE